MGRIRGLHNTPGVYTKVTPIASGGSAQKTAPKKTSNVSVGGGQASGNFYFGYIPIVSENGIISEEGLQMIQSLSGDEIKNSKTLAHTKSKESLVHLNSDSTIVPVSITKEEVERRIAAGETYNAIADENNSCVTIVVPLKNYEVDAFDIIDETFGLSIKQHFNEIKQVSIGSTRYVVLCMFNKYYSYALVGEDKIINPIKLILK